MAVSELTSENFEPVVRRDGIVLVSCWSPGCGVCRTCAPCFERVAENRPDHVFVRLNTFEERELASELTILHVPTLVAYRDGIHLVTLPGNYDEERLEFVLEKAAALDMEKVRAELDRSPPAAPPEKMG